MNDLEKKSLFEVYNERTHLFGRLACIITLVMLIGAPFVMGAYLGAMPDLAAVGRGFLACGIVWMVSCVAEYLVYTPMLGAGGGYLAFITGNLINMKIPCAMNARDLVDAKTGTPENEIISTLSIATSSLVTILVLAAGVVALIPLQPILQAPALQPAFDNVVPALFGAMAYKYYRGNLKIAAAQAAKEAAEKKPEKPEGCALIGIEDFMGVELRSAKIIDCERVPKAKKLLKLRVDLGYEQRQVVSGIAKFYAPEDLIGKKVIVVANLKPATLCGIASEGMILASGEEQVRVVFLSEDTPLGERIR